jgi:hypothetical protein
MEVFMEIKQVTASEMQLADTVRLFDSSYSAYCDATVKNITEEEVILDRPYTHSSDFSYTGGVILFTGIEECRLWKGSNTKYALLGRKELK